MGVGRRYGRSGGGARGAFMVPFRNKPFPPTTTERTTVLPFRGSSSAWVNTQHFCRRVPESYTPAFLAIRKNTASANRDRPGYRTQEKGQNQPIRQRAGHRDPAGLPGVEDIGQDDGLSVELQAQAHGLLLPEDEAARALEVGDQAPVLLLADLDGEVLPNQMEKKMKKHTKQQKITEKKTQERERQGLVGDDIMCFLQAEKKKHK